MGGPTVAIAVEELAHMGTDTFIRVGSCGVRQPGMKPGDILITTGVVRHGGTANAYLPIEVPAVPTFDVLRTLVETADERGVKTYVGVTAAGDAFYGLRKDAELLRDAHILGGEMESDTLFIVGQLRGWRTGALFASDGAPGESKPAWGREAFLEGERQAIEIGLEAMRKIAVADAAAT
jgi:uridine phosphorylase